ncbi:MAG: pyruvate carboxylase [Opitutales bacterium]|jgi:pyruvate carboxylase
MKKLLVANRSEIAVRVFRSATELGYRTVAIYAHEDRFGVHRFKADEAYLVGEGKGPVAAYLDIEGIVALAQAKGVWGIHPGYGFLSENARFSRACRAAGIVFIGPPPDVLEKMGDKTAAREIAEKAGVPTLPGTPHPISDAKEAEAWAKKIGFPLIIKAAHGGGGRGMRVVREAKELSPRLAEAQGESERAFGSNEVFLERFVTRAKHIEVQVLGDRHGHVLHLHERDCSVQRRHQKVVEIAPSVGLDPAITNALCQAAVNLARAVNYEGAGTCEFLYDMDTHEWFFIEMNPRIQVEHTVTEVITDIDLVRAQIQVAEGRALHDEVMGLPAQDKVPRMGWALQCRITTEDPEKNFAPDYGKIVNYRSAAGFGIRLDGAMGDTGSVITPFYDSLLVKLTASASTFAVTCQRMDRALREMRIRGVKTNLPFLENVVNHPEFQAGQATTGWIEKTPELFRFSRRFDRATKLLKYLGDVIVNGNPQVQGRPVPKLTLPLIRPTCDATQPPPPGTRDRLRALGPEKFAQWARAEKRLLVTDTTFRDAHQSLLAARVRTCDMLGCADALARRGAPLFSLEMWGGATFDTSLRFLHENPFRRLRDLREKIPNICFQMLLRGANGVGYSNYPDNVIRGFIQHSAESGMDIFRVFDSLNYLPNLKAAMEAILHHTKSICEAAICYTGDILDPDRAKYSLDYYVKLAKELEKRGAHMLAIKDMAGLCHPLAAAKLVKTLKAEIGLPVHFHTHDSSGIASASVLAACEAGVDVVDLAVSSMSGLTSQPNLNSVAYALRSHRRAPGLDVDFFNELSIYWEAVRQYYEPFDTSPKFGSAEVYRHEMPGGQYTNLREQATALGLGARWPEVVRYYREVNRLLGDIVKVTPSSKVVGDLAIFLLTRGVEPADLVNLPPGTAFPESVVDMLSGGLGQPVGGWPKKVQQVVLGDKKARTGRPQAAPVDLDATREQLRKLRGREITEDDLYCHLMYPSVYAEQLKFVEEFGHVRVIPTPVFFYGLKPGKEVAIDIEEGKRLYLKLISIGDPDAEGMRTLTFELNGRAREAQVRDRAVQPRGKPRRKADPADPKQVGAPIPAMISSLPVSVGHKVASGDKLCVLEAMKMQTTLYAQADGVVEEIAAQVGDRVEPKDLILLLR